MVSNATFVEFGVFEIWWQYFTFQRRHNNKKEKYPAKGRK